MQPIRRTRKGYVQSNRLELRRMSLSRTGDGSRSNASETMVEHGKVEEQTARPKAPQAFQWIMVAGILLLSALDRTETGGAFRLVKKRHLWRKLFVKGQLWGGAGGGATGVALTRMQLPSTSLTAGGEIRVFWIF